MNKKRMNVNAEILACIEDFELGALSPFDTISKIKALVSFGPMFMESEDKGALNQYEMSDEESKFHREAIKWMEDNNFDKPLQSLDELDTELFTNEQLAQWQELMDRFYNL